MPRLRVLSCSARQLIPSHIPNEVTDLIPRRSGKTVDKLVLVGRLPTPLGPNNPVKIRNRSGYLSIYLESGSVQSRLAPGLAADAQPSGGWRLTNRCGHAF